MDFESSRAARLLAAALTLACAGRAAAQNNVQQFPNVPPTFSFTQTAANRVGSPTGYLAQANQFYLRWFGEDEDGGGTDTACSYRPSFRAFTFNDELCEGTLTTPEQARACLASASGNGQIQVFVLADLASSACPDPDGCFAPELNNSLIANPLSITNGVPVVRAHLFISALLAVLGYQADIIPGGVNDETSGDRGIVPEDLCRAIVGNPTLLIAGQSLPCARSTPTDNAASLPGIDTACTLEGFGASCRNGLCTGPRDNCPGVPNPDQRDSDSDGIGDACDMLEVVLLDPVVDARLDAGASNPLLAGGAIRNDPNALAAPGAGRRVVGLAADGATDILVRTQAPGAGSVAFGLRDDAGGTNLAGTLRALGAAPTAGTTNLTVPVVALADGRSFAFAILRAPDGFRRGAQDDNRALRDLQLSADFVPAAGGIDPGVVPPPPVRLVRPPVALVHGIFGSDMTFALDGLEPLNPVPRPPNTPLAPVCGVTRSGAVACKVNYPKSKSFASNAPEIRRAVLETKEALRSMPAMSLGQPIGALAVTQVDYVGHSMGGVLGRRLINDGGYRRDNNFLQGDVHKFVEVSVPNAGSKLVDCALRLAQLPGIGGPIDRAFTWFGVGPLLDGAAADLSPNSPNARLAATQVPAHVVVALGGVRTFDNFVRVGEEFGSRDLGRFLELFNAVGLRPDTIFAGEQHDLAVSESSQLGGLASGSSAVSRFDAVLSPPAAGVHVTIAKEQRVASLITTLLDASKTGPMFASGLPASNPQAFTCPSVANLQLVDDGIDLVVRDAPPFDAGETVRVEVLDTGLRPVDVLVVTPNEQIRLRTAPFIANVRIPANASGTFPITAFARSSTFAVSFDTTSLTINGSAPPPSPPAARSRAAVREIVLGP